MNSKQNNDPAARISDALIQAYLGTTYSAQTDARRIALKVGIRSEELRTLAAIAERQRRLWDELTALGLTYFSGKGQGEDSRRPAEARIRIGRTTNLADAEKIWRQLGLAH